MSVESKLTFRRLSDGSLLVVENYLLELSKKRFTALLIHGFNNSKESACESYLNFRKSLRKQSRYLTNSVNIVSIYWPSRASILPLIRYPWGLNQAKDVGPSLAECLLRPDGSGLIRQDMVLIGHSLGCRLILETLNSLTGTPAVNERHRIKIFLMAAAIPVGLVRSGRRLREGLEFAHERTAMFSCQDGGLISAFKIGQTAARRGEGLFPEAVGRNGNPNDGAWTDRQPMHDYGHFDYWKGKESAQNVASSFDTTIRKPLLGRALPCWRKIYSWSKPDFRRIEARLNKGRPRGLHRTPAKGGLRESFPTFTEMKAIK